jgi:hypothetical protein
VLVAVSAGLFSSLLVAPSVSLAYAPGLFARFQHKPIEVRPIEIPRPALAALSRSVQQASARAGGSPALERKLVDGGVVLRQPKEAHGSFADVFVANQAAGLDSLLSAELAYTATAVQLSRVRRVLSRELLAPDLGRLIAGIQNGLSRWAPGGREPREARTRALAYMEVADRLLRGDSVGASGSVAEELARVDRAAGIERSALLLGVCDYSVFAGGSADPARTSEEALGDRRFELAATWLMRARFPLDREAGARTSLALLWGLLAGESSGERALHHYDRLREAADFLFGEPDGASAARILPRLRERVGPSLSVRQLDPELLEEIAADLERTRPVRIPGPAGTRPFFSLLGQRYALEPLILVGLSWPNVGLAEQPRLFAGGLDVLAVEGAVGAEARLLAQAAGAERLPQRLAELRAQHAQARRLPGSARHGDDLGYVLAYARDALSVPVGEPTSAVGERGLDRALTLGIASLDPLGVFVEPSEASPRDPSGPAPRVVCDPYPEWYARLAATARATSEGLVQARTFPSREALAMDLTALAGALDAMAAVARADLEGRARPADAEATLGDPAALCERFVGGRIYAAKVLSVVQRPGRQPLFRQRVVTGPIEAWLTVPGPTAGAEWRVARGPALRVSELSFERRVEASRALLGLDLPSLPFARDLVERQR